MKSPRKIKTIILIILGILFAFIAILTKNPRFITSEFKHDNLKVTAISGKIHIDGNSGWAAFRAAGNCTGNGTYAVPYFIEDLIIDGEGIGSCVLIENSDVYFRIENCTFYNAGVVSPNAGIQLSNVTKGKLIINNCSFSFSGINLDNCVNNTISGNTVHNNNYGLYYMAADNNIISGNTVNNNSYGIYYIVGDNNTISGNTANNNSYGIYYRFGKNNTISRNIVNQNYNNGIYLEYCDNSTISGNTVNENYDNGIWLSHSKYNIISGNTVNENYNNGIWLSHSKYNIISGNTANNNTYYGISLSSSNDNIVSGNALLNNDKCIVEYNCQGNEFSDNGDCTYGERDGEKPIPGYNLLFLVGILSVAVILISKKLKKS
ncbi:MAG: nitrous oxide reductase family maturation protein NosD [Candidatus Hodarchaeota archaeon]